MKYTILTLGSSDREASRARIRKVMEDHNEIYVETVRGLDSNQLTDNIQRHGFSHKDKMWRPGEAGLWYSNINGWSWCANQDEPLMIFEDDAQPNDLFVEAISSLDFDKNSYDFISLYTPFRNDFQKSKFTLGPTAQQHGNICLLYSPRGAQKILSLLRQNGLEWPVDIWLYKQGIDKKLTGLTPTMTSNVIIDHDWSVPTTIHEDDRIQT